VRFNCLSAFSLAAMAADRLFLLRLKPLRRTDLSGLVLQFDIEYDHALDGAMRFDALKYPSVSRDSITLVTGAGDLLKVKLLAHRRPVFDRGFLERRAPAARIRRLPDPDHRGRPAHRAPVR